MKKPNYGMQKFTAGGLAVAAILFFVSVGCSVTQMSNGEKHTGPVKVRCDNGRGFEFKRPNGEIFEMAFSPEYLGPKIKAGDELSDLTYTDEKGHLAFFVKATLTKEFEPPPSADKILYEGASYMYSCGDSGWVTTGTVTTTDGNPCTYTVNRGGKSYYRWKDGGYHDKPQPTKSK